MALPFSKKQKSINRVKAGMKRFLSTVAVEVKDLIKNEEFESSDEDFDEDLPEEIVSETKNEQDALALEQTKLDTWREQLNAELKDREERKIYFQSYLQESEERFQEKLFEAKEKLAGKALPVPEAPKSISEEIDENTEDTVPEPHAPVEQPVSLDEYRAPTIELLDVAIIDTPVLVEESSLEAQQKALQATLDNFAVDAFVYDAIVGPRVTQFRIQPGIGVRVESISSLQKNICLALANTNIRIQAPIPGEPFVGVEVGNGNTIPVRLRSMVESNAWTKTKHSIPLVMGMDIQGKIIITDLARAPHLLIAGATGSGKSVCMANLILSLLYNFRPDELELVLIDPKRVEFGMFKQIPHLIHSVVSEPKQAVQVLNWVVKEMETRYETLAEKQVRNIAGYNEKAEREGFKKLPFMVVIIDELADLMMTSKGDAEAALARIAQLSRAVGIHTIIATQRPSVNVITGVIKANYPTRIAFQVSSYIDSRTILDCKGAESLLGKGDFLFNPPGIAQLVRIQSPFVEDDEITRVVEHISTQRVAEHRVDLTGIPMPGEGGKSSALGEVDPNDDEALFKQALLTVAETQKASTSFIQRRLRIGYNRAATLIEEMEDRMYIGPQNGSTPREVFVTAEDCEWCKQ